MLTINELQKQVFDLYNAQRFSEMSDLLTREKASFPVEAQYSYFNWQMCAAALQGKIDQALIYFQEAIDAGCWYGRHALHEDPDLAAMQGNPEFERLTVISEARAAEEQANATPVLKVFPPTDAQPPYPWLMMLHGNASNLLPENLNMFLANLQPAADHGYLLALPQSSQMRGKARYIWDDIDWATGEIQKHLAALQADYPIDPAQGVLSGYSMGGGLALYMALSGKLAVKQIVVAAPWWGNIAELEAAIAAGGADHMRVAIIVSRHDVDCYRVATAVNTALAARGLTGTLLVTDEADHSFPAGFHDLLATELNAAPLKS